jgi:hypothetical protein
MSSGKFVMAAGGWPIRIDGATVGGIGVSGGNAPGRDDEIARAGLAVLEAMAAPIPIESASSANNAKQYNDVPSTRHLPPDEYPPYEDQPLNQFNAQRTGGMNEPGI